MRVVLDVHSKKLLRLLLCLLLGVANRHVCSGPKVTQVADGKVDLQPHLSRHDHECHIPTKQAHDEKQSSTSLGIMSATKILRATDHLTFCKCPAIT